MPFGFFDPTMVLLLPALIFAFWAQWRVQHTYNEYSKVRAANGLTGREMARAIMVRNGITTSRSSRWTACSATLRPRVKKVRLSDPQLRPALARRDRRRRPRGGPRCSSTRAANFPLALRPRSPPVAGFGSMLAFPLFFIGLIFGHARWLMDLGILFFSGAVVFQIITLPVEFDASKRALAELTSSGSLAPQEVARREKGAGRPRR